MMTETKREKGSKNPRVVLYTKLTDDEVYSLIARQKASDVPVAELIQEAIRRGLDIMEKEKHTD